ncbi:MAG TPA: hypothetical protein VFM53_14940 [Anaeromyxobacteraceae bacterium]|nr:hypothetical protein [Anaeromyxobacteraceae bacterium]
MRWLAIALLVSAPLPSRAQYVLPPPPVRVVPVPVVPVPAAPPRPVLVAPAPPAQSPFYVNLGVGGGVQSGWDAWGPWSAGGLAWNAELGARLAPQLLVGFDVVGLSVFGNSWSGTPGSTLVGYDAVLTLFPFTRGFFLRGGGGLSTFTVSDPFGPSVTSTGSNALVGAGWAFPVAPPVHLTLGVDWAWHFIGSAGMADAGTWMIRAGFGIY